MEHDTTPANLHQDSSGGAPDAAAARADRALGIDLDEVTRDLVEVEAALERLDDGTYGRCLACSSAIDDDSLASDPTQATCAQHLPV